MAQNIYNTLAFFAIYATLLCSQERLAGAPEWPDLRQMVGSVAENRILDLGCGYGWFCRWAVENGAREVCGLDISQIMLDKATRDWEVDERITYQGVDLDEWDGKEKEEGEGGYDLVFSSLALHYVRETRPLFRKIHAALAPVGRFVFSIEHPLFTAPVTSRVDPETNSWMLNSYHYEGERTRG